MKRPSRPLRRRPPADALQIVLTEDDLAVIVAAATKAREAALEGRSGGGTPASAGFAGIADLVPALPGLPGGHSSIRDQVYAAPPPLPAPGVSEAIRKVRNREEE